MGHRSPPQFRAGTYPLFLYLCLQTALRNIEAVRRKLLEIVSAPVHVALSEETTHEESSRESRGALTGTACPLLASMPPLNFTRAPYLGVGGDQEVTDDQAAATSAQQG